MRAKKVAKARAQAEAVERLEGGMSESKRAEVMAMVKAGRKFDAIHRVETEKRVDLTTAYLVVRKLTGEQFRTRAEARGGRMAAAGRVAAGGNRMMGPADAQRRSVRRRVAMVRCATLSHPTVCLNM